MADGAEKVRREHHQLLVVLLEGTGIQKVALVRGTRSSAMDITFPASDGRKLKSITTSLHLRVRESARQRFSRSYQKE